MLTTISLVVRWRRVTPSAEEYREPRAAGNIRPKKERVDKVGKHTHQCKSRTGNCFISRCHLESTVVVLAAKRVVVGFALRMINKPIIFNSGVRGVEASGYHWRVV